MKKILTKDMANFVLQAQKGDENAFSSLVLSVKDDLYKLAEQKMKNTEDAEDALSQTALLAFKNINQLREPSFFKTWVTRILINECNKIYEQRKKDASLYDKLTCSNNTFESYFNIDCDLDLSNSLEILNPNDNLCMTLHYFYGYKDREIAKLLGVTESTVHGRIVQSKKKIKFFYGNTTF